jgi:hypothetical protein
MNTNVRGTYKVKATNIQLDSANLDVFAGTFKRTVTGETHLKFAGDKYEWVGADTYSTHDDGTDYSCPVDPPRSSDQDCTTPTDATQTGLSTPEVRANVTPKVVKDLAYVNHKDAYVMNNDGVAPTKTYIDQGVSEGIFSQSDINTSAPAPTAADPTTGSTTDPIDVQQVQGSDFPDTYRLSPNFTLYDITVGPSASHDRVRAQHGLTEAQIVTNLKALAENVLEPLKARYGSRLHFTSGFRLARNGSQHEKGQAVDLRVHGVNKKEYYDLAREIRGLAPMDQMLLEYQSTGTGIPWIHISFNHKGNRGQVMTFYNHGKVGSGLINLV